MISSVRPGASVKRVHPAAILRRRDTVGVLFLAAWLVSLALVTSVVMEHVKDALLPCVLSEGGRHDVPELLRIAIGALTRIDLGVIGATLLLSVVLVCVERRYRAVTQALTAPGWALPFAGALLVLWFGHSYLGRGYLLSGDTVAHVAMIASRTAALISGDNPAWSNMSYFGLPLAGYYSPTTFWPLSGIDVLLRDPSSSLRVFLLLAHLASGAAIALLARQLGLSRLATFFATVAYSGAFAHLHLLLYRGAVPQALSVALLPLCLLFVHRVLTETRLSKWSWCGLVLSSAGLAVNYEPLAIVAGIYIALFAVALWVSQGAPVDRGAALGSAGLLAAAVAAFALLPGALADNVARPVQPAEWVRIVLPDRDYFDHLLVWRAWRTNLGGAAAYLGLTVVGLAAYAVWQACARAIKDFPAAMVHGQTPVTLGFAVLLIASFFVRGMHVRDIVFTLLFVAVLAGIGADLLARSGRLGRSGPAILMGLVTLDLGSTAMQSIGRSDKGYLDVAANYLEHQVPPSRTIVAKVDGNKVTMSGGGIFSWHNVELVDASHAEMATRAWIYGAIAEALVARDLSRTGDLSERTRALLCLLRVGRIVAADRTHIGMPETIAAAAAEGPLGRVVKTGCRYQAVFATALVPEARPPIDSVLHYGGSPAVHALAPFGPFFETFRGLMQLDPDSGVAARIPVIGITAAVEVPAGTVAPGFTVGDYRVSTGRVAVTLDTQTPGFVRLSHAAHPSLHVLRNGAEIAAFEDPMGFLVVPVAAGKNRIEIVPHPLPVEVVADRISLGAVAAVALLLLGWSRTERRRRTEIPAGPGR